MSKQKVELLISPDSDVPEETVIRIICKAHLLFLGIDEVELVMQIQSGKNILQAVPFAKDRLLRKHLESFSNSKQQFLDAK